jgi:hypothetical protein
MAMPVATMPETRQAVKIGEIPNTHPSTKPNAKAPKRNGRAWTKRVMRRSSRRRYSGTDGVDGGGCGVAGDVVGSGAVGLTPVMKPSHQPVTSPITNPVNMPSANSFILAPLIAEEMHAAKRRGAE